MAFYKTLVLPAVALLGGALVAGSASAANGPGVTDTEVVLGETMPYSGPASAYGVIGKAEAAYFTMINEQGGVNGRQIRFISLDDGYSPPKTVEQIRKLVEQENVLAVYGPLGTGPNTAVQKYMNAKKVPTIFLATGATKFGQPDKFHWTMGWQPTYAGEAVIYAKYILANLPKAKIGILYQNDDFGKDYLDGFNRGLGTNGQKLIIKQESYETTDPTIDSQVVTLKGSGADVLFDVTTPKFAAQTIRKVYDVDWHPTHFLTTVSSSVGAVLKPAGLEKAKGIISTQYLMDPSDPQWQKTAEFKTFAAWVQKYLPDANMADNLNVYGYLSAQTMVQVLKQCGNDLSRENVMKQAANLKDFHPAMLLPGININTSATDYYPIEEEQLIRFDGEKYQLFGDILSSAQRGS